MEENYLAAMAAHGDREALASLVTRYRHYVYTIAYKITLNEEDAFDITQNVFLKVVTNISQFKSEGSFRSWLATISSHEALSYLRGGKAHEFPVPPERMSWLIDRRQPLEGAEVIDVIENQDRRRLVEQAMGGLSDQQRAIVVLFLTEDMRPTEIARRLGIPAPQVGTQLKRAMVKLRETLEGPKEQSKQAAK